MSDNFRVCQVNQVLARRQASLHDVEYLVRWAGDDIDEASWASVKHLSPNAQALIEKFNESIFQTSTSQRCSPRNKTVPSPIKMLTTSPTGGATRSVGNQNSAVSPEAGNSKEPGSRWSLRRFSHDSKMSSSSSTVSGSVMSGAAMKSKRKKSDQTLMVYVPSSNSVSPTRSHRAITRTSSSSPPSVQVVGPTVSPSTKTPINIITDYGLMSAPLTPSPSVKSPRGSPCGAQQQLEIAASLVAMDHHSTSRSKKAATVKQRVSHSPSTSSTTKASPKAGARSPKAATAAGSTQFVSGTRSAVVSAKTKKTSLDSASSSLFESGRRLSETLCKEKWLGSLLPRARSLDSDRGKRCLGIGDSEALRCTLTPEIVKVGSKKRIDCIESNMNLKASPKKSKSLEPCPVVKSQSRKRSLSNSSNTVTVLSPDNVLDNSRGRKAAGECVPKKRRTVISVLNTYPSRIRQSWLPLDLQHGYSGAKSPISTSPKAVEISTATSPNTISTSPKPVLIAKSKAVSKVAVKNKDVVSKKKAKPILKAWLKSADQPQLKWTEATMHPVKHDTKKKRKSEFGEGDNKMVSIAALDVADAPVKVELKNKSGRKSGSKQGCKSGCKPRPKPRQKLGQKLKESESNDGPSESQVPNIKLKSSPASTSSNVPSVMNQKKSIFKQKKSNLALDISKRLNTSSKKKVTLNAPSYKTPRKKRSLFTPRSPRKSPRIILKDVIKLSQLEYDMAMTTAMKFPSPVAKKVLNLKSPKPQDDLSSTTVKNVAKLSSMKEEPNAVSKKDEASTLKDSVKSTAKNAGAKKQKSTDSTKITKTTQSNNKDTKVSQVQNEISSNAKQKKEKAEVPRKASKNSKETVSKVKAKKKLATNKAISPASSDDDVLYSLNPDYDSDNSTESLGSLPSPSNQVDSEVTAILGIEAEEFAFGVSPRKLLLKDSLKAKTKIVKPVPRQAGTPVSPAKVTAATVQEGANYKTPPKSPLRTSCAQSDNQHRYMSDLPTIPVMPLIPTSPSTASYQALVRDLPHSLHSVRGSKRSEKNSDSGEDEVERRVSVRNSESAFRYKEIIVKKCAGYTQMWLFTTSKTKNALNPKVLQELSQALHNAKFDDSRVVLLSGSGSIFCSGVDLNYLLSGDRRLSAQTMADALRDFVSAVITFPKPIVAAVNGPAIGLGAAILPLCDIIYASDKASFSCPYGRLAQTPEGCSSFTFPQVMGMAMANDMLLGGRKLTAIEAYQMGLVSQVFWPTSMMQEVIPRVQHISNQSIRSLEGSKLLIRSQQRAKMELTNESECRMLADRWASAECQKAMRTYLDDELDYMM